MKKRYPEEIIGMGCALLFPLAMVLLIYLWLISSAWPDWPWPYR